MESVEVARNTRRLVGLASFLGFVALCSVVSLVTGVVWRDGASIVGGLLGLAVTVWPAWSLLRPVRRPTPAMVVDAEGFEDRLAAAAEPYRVPWSQVTGLGIARPWTQYGRRQLVGVHLRQPGAVLAGAGWRRSLLETAAQGTGFDLVLETRLTALTPEQLVALLEEWRARS